MFPQWLDPKAFPDNLVLMQLRGMRKELAAVLENQARDRQLILRIVERMEEGFSSTRRELSDLRSDLTLIENNLLTRHNEILDPLVVSTIQQRNDLSRAVCALVNSR